MITSRIKTRLETLNIPSSDAVVVGSGILAALDIRQSNDIDLMVSKETFQKVADQGHVVSQYEDGSGQLQIDDVELMYSWQGRTIADYLLHTVEIDGVQFISLDDVIAWKREQNRPKDQKDIELINKYRENLL